jgi:hypothetical protein
MQNQVVDFLMGAAKKDKNLQAMLSGNLDSIDLGALVKLAKQAGIDVDESQIKEALKVYQQLQSNPQVKGFIGKFMDRLMGRK